MRIAIVTGASAGLGREYVKEIPRIYKEIDAIWVIARRKERLEALKFSSDVPIYIFEGDLAKEEIYTKLLQELVRQDANIRMLVNCAGVGKYGPFMDTTQEEQLQMVSLNCYALTKMLYTCLPFLKKGSRIIQLSSAAAFTPQPYFSVYAATKAYVMSLSLGLREEMKKSGIYITCVCPGPVKTEFFDIAGSHDKFTNETLITTPKKVVDKSLIAAIKKKPVCVCGPYMKGLQIAGKLLPDTISAKIMYIFNKYNS